MMTDASSDATGEAPSTRVETDLPCAKCGYNLRTLAWDAKCTECGEPVVHSAPRHGFRFRSERSANRVRTGIGILAASLLAVTLSTAAFTIILRLIFVVPISVYWPAHYSWVYVRYLASPLQFLAMLLIVQPFAQRHERFKPRIGQLAFVLAILGLMGDVGELTLERSFWGAMSPPQTLVAVRNILGLCWPFAYLGLCVHLLLRVERTAERTLWAVMCLALIGPLLVLCADALFTIGCLLEPSSWRWQVWVLTDNSRPIYDSEMLQPAWWWQNYVVPIAHVAMLLALWLFVRRLRAALRTYT